MNQENTPDDYGFDEFIEENTSYLDKLRHIQEVAIYPQELVVLPYESMTLRVTDANYQQLFADADGDDVWLGIAPRLKGDRALPPIGSIGVGADVEEIDQMPDKTQLVKIRGVVRFTIDEYIETDRPYALARITFFEDSKELQLAEKELYPELARELRELMKEYNRKHGKYKHLDTLPDSLKDEHLEAYSFFFWIVCAPLTAKLREMLLEIRSTVQRAYLLNRQLESTLEKLDKIKPAHFN